MLGFVNGLAIIIFKAQFGQFMVDGGWMPAAPLMVMLALVGLTMAIIHFLPKLTTAMPATHWLQSGLYQQFLWYYRILGLKFIL